jgi:uncharacterized protein YkwD
MSDNGCAANSEGRAMFKRSTFYQNFRDLETYNKSVVLYDNISSQENKFISIIDTWLNNTSHNHALFPGSNLYLGADRGYSGSSYLAVVVLLPLSNS